MKLTFPQISRRRFLETAGTAAAGLALGGTLASPAIAQGAQPVTLRLDYIPQGFHAPIFYGVKKGFYKDQGIDLQVSDGKGTNVALQAIVSGNDQIAIANYSSVIQSVSVGMPVIGIGGMIQKLPDAVISLAGSGIKAPKDLEGLTMAIAPKSGIFRLFPAFCALAGVDINKIKLVQVDPSVSLQLLVQRQVAFAAAWLFTDSSRLAAQFPMEKPLLMADYGLNVLGNGFTVRKDTAATQGPMLTRFMTATARSYVEGIKDFTGAAAAMAEARPASNDVETLQRECREMEPFTYTKRSQPLGFGYTVKEDWQDTSDIVTKYFGMEKPVNIADLYTNDFLPKKS
jgi:NitT/TauT family transport system substrate-binding protein